MQLRAKGCVYPKRQFFERTAYMICAANGKHAHEQVDAHVGCSKSQLPGSPPASSGSASPPPPCLDLQGPQDPVLLTVREETGLRSAPCREEVEKWEMHLGSSTHILGKVRSGLLIILSESFPRSALFIWSIFAKRPETLRTTSQDLWVCLIKIVVVHEYIRRIKILSGFCCSQPTCPT